MNNNVNHPNHYTTGKIEVIDIIQDRLTNEGYEGYLEGNVLKYLCRWRHKNGVEDLMKAAWYSNRLINLREEMKSEGSHSTKDE